MKKQWLEERTGEETAREGEAEKGSRSKNFFESPEEEKKGEKIEAN